MSACCALAGVIRQTLEQQQLCLVRVSSVVRHPSGLWLVGRRSCSAPLSLPFARSSIPQFCVRDARVYHAADAAAPRGGTCAPGRPARPRMAALPMPRATRRTARPRRPGSPTRKAQQSPDRTSAGPRPSHPPAGPSRPGPTQPAAQTAPWGGPRCPRACPRRASPPRHARRCALNPSAAYRLDWYRLDPHGNFSSAHSCAAPPCQRLSLRFSPGHAWCGGCSWEACGCGRGSAQAA